MDERVLALTTWDPDGGGPLAAQLVATGGFTTAGGQPVNSIARWDGAQWQPFGTGLNGWGFALTTWDPDGAGPLPAQLVVGGGFTTAGGQPANNIARWDGTQWLPFGTGMNSTVYSLTTWDPDGDGPLTPQIVAGGLFVFIDRQLVLNIAYSNGTQWYPFGLGLDLSVFSLTPWDPDGTGPLAEQPVVGGQFFGAGGQTLNRIARWDGARWQPFGTGVNDAVFGLTTWDPDGGGPLAAQVVAGGSFTTAGEQPASKIARWDGTQWQPFGCCIDRNVYVLINWDPDGPGPQAALLVAGGIFTTAQGQTVNCIAGWDGSQWLPFGTGMSVTQGSATRAAVNALTTWDPDGPGPQATQLIAGGQFSIAGGQQVRSIARWDGIQWHPFGSGLNASVSALTTWDGDGAGPFPPQVVAGGYFSYPGELPAYYVVRWDGAQWRPLGAEMDGLVSSLTTFDPDGDGPLAVQLAAGGFFVDAGGVPSSHVALWGGCPDAPAPCAGDADGDRTVSFADVTAVLVHFGSTGLPYSPGDASGDGLVNASDIVSVLLGFDTPCP